MGKSAQFPLHVWLPDAMEGPTPVSALIHAATMVTAGVYLLHRTSWLFALTPDVLLLIAWIGALTALLAAVLACVQDDIKRVLAYSTVSQLGYMMTAIGAGFSAAGFFHLLTHGVFKALLFLGAGAVIHAVGSNDLSRMGGLARRMPQTAIVFVIGTLSLAGIPLFAGFVSKEEILGAVWAGSLPGPFFVLMLVAFLTAFYMFRVVFRAFFGSSRQTRESHHGAPRTRSSRVDAAAALDSDALLSHGGRHLLRASTRSKPEFESPNWLTPAAVSVALAGSILAWLTYQRKAIDASTLASLFGPFAAPRWRSSGSTISSSVYSPRPMLAFSRLVGWIDRYLVDGVLNVVSAWTVTTGDEMRSIQTGRAQDYVYGLAVGLLLLLVWVRWSLT